MAVTASFAATSGTLTVIGDNLDNNISLSRNAAGNILVNGGAVAVVGGTPTVANVALMQVFGLGGNDVITLSESNGALPAANLFGGEGNDTLTGGSGGDKLFGQAGNDVLFGKGGFDQLFGGSENDTLTGGDADDQMFGESGDDRMIWNPGDDTDLAEGGAGNDTAEVNGGGGAEVFTTTANGTRVRFDRLDPAPFAIDIGTSENLVLNMNGGDDSFSATGNLAALIKIIVDGGAGNDTILGSNGVDLLLGGDGDDFIDGQQGNDVAFLGAGKDVFQWDPGDGSDVVEGQDGADTLLFNGSAGDEIFAASANGGRVLFTRNLGNIVMDLDDVEKIELNALGGTDTLTVNDLSGTNVAHVAVNLSGVPGGTAGDAKSDVVIVNATNGADIVDVAGAGTSISVLGLAAQVAVTSSEGANDSVVINALGGDDGITATTLPAGVARLTLDGGAGDDTLLGSQGADVFLGGDGDDFVFGDNGNDLALLGAGNDVFQWNPGDGNDTLEGQDGKDTMLFFGSGASENIQVSANGGRAIFFRDVANVTMDLDDVESIDFRALGGADNIVVGDLSGTDVTQVGIDLRGPNGGGDAAADTVAVNATQGADVFGVAGDAGGVKVFGLQASVNIFFPEAANDRLTLNGLGGDDVINASGLEADGLQLAMNGGLGDDIFVGSEGNDLINGGDGGDTALMGAGDDVFVWNPGDDNDTLEGQAGIDTMLFNGSNVAEIITVAANGGRALLFRDVANVLMDLNDVEHIDFKALGGADKIVVDDLSGTDVELVAIDLAASLGGDVGDAQPDRVFVSSTDGNDGITVALSGTKVLVNGLSAQVAIEHAEDANDHLTINGLAGGDAISAAAIVSSTITLSLDGGVGNDTLTGGFGAGASVSGGDGDDLIFQVNGTPEFIDGGAGIDTLNTTAFSGSYLVNLATGATNFFGESFINLENIVAGSGSDTLIGTLGVNFINGGAGNDTISAGSDRDTIVGGLGADSIDGESGFDLADYSGSDAAVNVDLQAGTGTGGTAEGDTFASIEIVAGSSFGDRIRGAIGNDTIAGGEGHDTLQGGFSTDSVDGGGGNDTIAVLQGEFGDNVDGGSGVDRLDLSGLVSDAAIVSLGARTWSTSAGAGVTAIVGIEHVDGGSGNDSLTGNGLGNAITGGAGNDTVNASGGNDTVGGGDGDDAVIGEDGNDIVDGGIGNDLAAGGAGNDSVAAGDGNDRLVGGAGDDTLAGGIGDDLVNGGMGKDLMLGQAGADVFDFNDVLESGLVAATRDTIVDFSTRGTDLIDLASIDADAAAVGNQAFDFIGAAGFTGLGQVRLFSSGGNTYVDLNTQGNLAADMRIELIGIVALDAGDFVL